MSISSPGENREILSSNDLEAHLGEQVSVNKGRYVGVNSMRPPFVLDEPLTRVTGTLVRNGSIYSVEYIDNGRKLRTSINTNEPSMEPRLEE